MQAQNNMPAYAIMMIIEMMLARLIIMFLLIAAASFLFMPVGYPEKYLNLFLECCFHNI